MAKAKFFGNVFAQFNENDTLDRYNQFLGKVGGFLFVYNVVKDNNGAITGYRVVDKEAAVMLANQGKYVGGTQAQQLVIANSLGTYTQLGEYRDSATNLLKSDYVPADADLNASVKQIKPYADPFTLLGVATTANEMRLEVGLPIENSASGGGTDNSTADTKKSLFNTLDILTGDNTKVPTAGYDLDSIKEAWEKDAVGTALIGLAVVEVGNFALNAFTGKPQETVIVGALLGKPTKLTRMFGGAKRKTSRKKGKGKDKGKKKKGK